MTDTDYLRQGKQLEDLYRRKAAAQELLEATELMDKICQTKQKLYFSGYETKNHILDIKTLAKKVAKYQYENLLLHLEEAVDSDSRHAVLRDIYATFSSEIQKELVIEDSRDVSLLDEEGTSNFSHSEWFSEKKAKNKPLLKVSYQSEFILGYTVKHKANRSDYCSIYFGKNKNSMYPVMEPALFLGYLYLYDMCLAYLKERKSGASTDRDYVFLLIEKTLQNLDSMQEERRQTLVEDMHDRNRVYEQNGYSRMSPAQKAEMAKENRARESEYDQELKEKNEIFSSALKSTTETAISLNELSQGSFWELIKNPDLTKEHVNVYLLYVIISALMTVQQNYHLERVYRRNASSDYARSFETKKNIPSHVLEYMQNCSFNETFGFVEIDADCDKDKIDILWQEFSQFKREYFAKQSCKDETIRFRKLGAHKAAGLYYPQYHCMCIDVSNPGSMVHEFGHLVDYANGKLSLQKEFEPVLFCYQSLLEDMPKEAFPSKGKYNLDYYLTPTEVFARSLEMYLGRCEKIDSDILETDDQPCYPQDKELMKLIERYWKDLLKK